MRPFKGFNRKAIVVVPSDEIYQQRLNERNKPSNKSVHEDAILEMKGSMDAVEACAAHFNSVTYCFEYLMCWQIEMVFFVFLFTGLLNHFQCGAGSYLDYITRFGDYFNNI